MKHQDLTNSCNELKYNSLGYLNCYDKASVESDTGAFLFNRRNFLLNKNRSAEERNSKEGGSLRLIR